MAAKLPRVSAAPKAWQLQSGPRDGGDFQGSGRQVIGIEQLTLNGMDPLPLVAGPLKM